MQTYALSKISLKKSIDGCKNVNFFIHGGEPCQTIESLSLIKEKLKNLGYNDTEILDIQGENTWEDLLTSLESLSLFASRKIIIAYLPTVAISKTGSQILQKISSQTNEDIALIFIAKKLSSHEQNTKWFKSCQNNFFTILAIEPNRKNIRQYIKEKFEEYKFNYNECAVNLIADKYEGNLNGATQTLNKLKLFYVNEKNKKLTAETVRNFVFNGTKFNSFDLIDSMIEQNIKKSFAILESLKKQNEDPILILWAINKEIRTLIKVFHDIQNGMAVESSCKKNGIWLSKANSISKVTKILSINQLQKILQKVIMADFTTKKIIDSDIWSNLKNICCAFFNISNLKLEEDYIW